MAKIELKNTNIYLRDGLATSGMLGAEAGVAGDTELNVDGGGFVVPVGMLFQIVGSDRLHRVTAQTDAAGETTNMVFTPALSAATLDNAVITVNGRSVLVKVGDGNLTWTENREFDYDLDRGVLDTVRSGDDQPMEVNLDLVYEFITAVTGGSADPTVNDALKNTGQASTWVTASADACEPYAVDLVLEQAQPCTGVEPELIIFPDFRYESLAHDTDEATISMSGRCNATQPTVTRQS